MKALNPTELQVMEFLWKLEEAFMKDIVSAYPNPKPAYTTVSTLVNRMVGKGYIGFEKIGRDKRYFPLLKKHVYFQNHLKGIIGQFFNNSAGQFASFFTKNTKMSVEELETLQQLVDEQLKLHENNKK